LSTEAVSDGSFRAEDNGVRALALVPVLYGEERDDSAPKADSAAKLEEAVGLAQAIRLNVIQSDIVLIHKPNPATLFGKGKTEEIGALIKERDIALAVIDHPLSPIQQRNLEKAWSCKVIDRTALILEIFGERARTKEGVLQVELAHLNYQKGRLVRSWTHLERQRGGSGFLGGPGETQIEADRRILQDKITRIKRELEKTIKTRTLHRAKRKKAPYPVIALAGYTNAGKSTLFNKLTGADVIAENMLFATLDPTLRRIKLNADGKEDDTEQGDQTLILSDTVGFISHLPTHLVAAFRATLEEVVEADLILHVRDMANPDNAAHRHDVIEILNSLGVDTENPDKIAEVWNKADLLPEDQQLYLAGQAETALLPTVLVSAVTGRGLDRLRALIAEKTLGELRKEKLELMPQELSLLDWLHRHGAPAQQHFLDDGSVSLEASLSEADWGSFSALRRQLMNSEMTEEK